MRFSFTILLAISALVLTGLAVVFTGSEYRNAIFGAPPVAHGEKLFSVKELDQVRQISLSNSDGDRVSFKLDSNNVWQAQTPWKDRADPLYMRFLIQFTAQLEVKETLPRKGLDLSKFGLKEGHTRVTMSSKSGKTISDFLIGRPTAWKIPSEDGKSTQPTVFIRYADEETEDTIYICGVDSANSIHSLFQNQFARFRDHHPFHVISPRLLDKVKVQNGEGEVVVSRKDLKSAWAITKPLELRVDPASLGTLFKDLAKLTALKVEDRANVTLPTGEDETAQAQEISIRFAGQPDDISLRIYPPAKEGDSVVLATISNRPDAVFHLPLTAAAAIPSTTPLSQLQTGVNDLRSKTMTHLNGPQLKTIIIRPEGRTPIMLQRTKQTVWRVLRRKGYELANQDAVIDLMTAVTRDKVQKFVTDAATDLKPYGLDRPFLQLGFLSFHNQGMRISFGRDPKDATNQTIYAHIAGRPNIWQISPETLSKISQNSWEWRTAHVWHLPKVDIRNIEIQRKNKPVVELGYTWNNEQWSAKRAGAEATAELNPNRANKFLTAIESLQTKRWLGPMYPPAMKALETPDTVIRVTIVGVDDQGEEKLPIVKTLSIAHTPGGLINFAKVDTTPRGPETEDESSYFLLDAATTQKLYFDLFE